MTRVTRRPVSVLGRRSSGVIAKRKVRKHKVILESVTREKKKLRSVISFEAKAPPGYTFITAGDPHFTTTCKERCRRDGLKVYAVSTTPHLHTHGLSQHVHRIGYHFPSAVVADVCINRGLYLTAAGKAVSFYGMSNEASHKHTDSIAQITINTEARDVLKDLFPNIPDNDLNQIIKTAFQKGQRKVGTAIELPLARRAQLAVVAHIRHIYTDYDRLLKSTSFHEARVTVEQPTLAKLVEWRGDDENGKTALEDVFREVIVISDDDDSDVEAEPPSFPGRNTSVEVISGNPVVEELPMKPVNQSSRALHSAQTELPEDEAAPGFRFIKEPARKSKVDRRGFSRYQAWDRAINRYRNMATSSSGGRPPAYSTGRPLQENLGHGREAPLRRHFDPCHPVAPVALPNQEAAQSNSSRPALHFVPENRVSCAPSYCLKRSPREPRLNYPAVLTWVEPYELYPQGELPDKRRNARSSPNLPNAVPGGRVPIPEPAGHRRDDSSNVPIFVSGPKESLEWNRQGLRPLPQPSAHLSSRNVNPQDHVLPSIENPLAVEIKRPNSGHMDHLARRMSGAFTFRSVTPHRPKPQDFSHTLPQAAIEDQVAKRRRVAYHDPVLTEKPLPPSGSNFLRSYPENHHAMAEQPSVQDGFHIRRRYFAPGEPHHTSQRSPHSAQGSSTSTARPERDGEKLANFANHGPLGIYDGQPSCNRHDYFQFAHHKSPGQPHIGPDMRYAAGAGAGLSTNAHPHPSALTGQFPSHNAQNNIGNGMRAPEGAGSHLEPVWRNKTPIPSRFSEKQKLYDDGFVRHVDLREPVLMEHGPVPQLSSHQSLENPSQSVDFDSRGIETRLVHRDNRTRVPPASRTYLDAPTKISPRQYPVMSVQGVRYHDCWSSRKPPPVYHDKRQPELTVNPSRSAWATYDTHQRDVVREEQWPKAYTRRAESGQYALPEGRSVVIVD